ncbi:SAV_6107 family HEPN domain-containing protein [Kineococcus sp. SYSU DK003]|uniref:SAV_6107 family HEPN domain-containing protein n=1 Tax=Kineococcus sp. SYSU DK003 TaxID=3383124 RepID=UPI003D7D0DB7
MPTTFDVPAGVPRPLTTAALDLLARCEDELLTALRTDDVAERYVHAHLAALRAGAALVAVHGRPAVRGRRGGGPRSVWEMLQALAPDLQGWSDRFASTAAVRSAVEAGRTGMVDAASADDLLADAERFHRVVESRLGLSALPLAG